MVRARRVLDVSAPDGGLYAARKSVYERGRHGAHGEDFTVGSCLATDSVNLTGLVVGCLAGQQGLQPMLSVNAGIIHLRLTPFVVAQDSLLRTAVGE